MTTHPTKGKKECPNCKYGCNMTGGSIKDASCSCRCHTATKGKIKYRSIKATVAIPVGCKDIHFFVECKARVVRKSEPYNIIKTINLIPTIERLNK
jgi:hypothetical protein